MVFCLNDVYPTTLQSVQNKMTLPFSLLEQPFYITGPGKHMFIWTNSLRGFFQTQTPLYFNQPPLKYKVVLFSMAHHLFL